MMDSIFLWVLIFAGAAVALLGLFLVASERELKNKRREIEGLIARLETQAQPAAPARSMRTNDAESAELLARNRELENQIDLLSDELAQSRRSIEMLQAAQPDVEAQDQITRLSIAHEELGREAQELRSRLAASEADLQSARRDDDAPALSRMQAQIDELRRALDHSRARVTELEEARNDLPDLNAIARERESERQNFQTQIADLEKRLVEQRQELDEAQTLRQRIAESERNEQALRAEISRYEEEIPTWQARIVAAEASASRLAALRRPYQELLTRHASIAELQRGLQEELAALAQQISAPMDGAHPTASVGFSAGSRSEAAGVSGNDSSSPKPVPFEDNTAGTAKASAEEAASGAATDPRTHRFGLFIALLFTMATGIVAVQFLGSEWEQPSVEAVTAKAHEPIGPPPSPAPARQETGSPSEKMTAPAPTKIASVKAATRQNERFTEKPDSPAPTQTGASGIYKATRSSRVYAAPNELSPSLGDIEPGVNVNVVNARDGWLEIHSKHGRPPGFIRQEAVVRVPGAN